MHTLDHANWLRLFGSVWVCSVFFSLLLACNAGAQVENGQIIGVIADSSGGVVANATVEIGNRSTGYQAIVESDRTGFYRTTELIPGLYTISIAVPGFKTAMAQNLDLHAGTAMRVDFKLVIGPHSETIEVNDAARLVNTDNFRLSYTVDSNQIASLPLNGRNVYSLIQYQPGAINVHGILHQSGVATPTVNVVNGARDTFNGFLTNGISNTDLSSRPMNTPILDTVREFQVSTLNNSAEFGSNAGAITNVITKSGTNHLHGSAWEFLRNEAFDANPFFANSVDDPANRKRLPLRLNQFGATVGGPIKQDKLFFFAGYQREKFVTSAPVPVLAESAQFRAATIAAFPNSVAALLYSSFPPAGPAAPQVTLRQSMDFHFDHFFSFADYLCPAATDGLTRTPGAMSQKFATLFGVEQGDIDQLNATCPGGSPYSSPKAGTFNRDADFLDLVVDPGPAQSFEDFFDGDEVSLRLDYIPTRNDRLFTQLNWAASGDKYVNRTLRGFAGPSRSTSLVFQVSFLHTFTPTSLNEFRVAYLRGEGAIKVPLPGVPLVSLDVLGFGANSGDPGRSQQNILNLNEVFSTVHGKHNSKFGGELRRNRDNTEVNAGRPAYRFFDSLFFAIDAPFSEEVGIDPGFSSNSPAHLETNLRHWRNWNIGVFLKDDWKVSRRLTLSLGLRYDVYTSPNEFDNMATTFKLGPGTHFIDDISTGAGQIKDASMPCPGDPRATLAGECGPGGFDTTSSLSRGDHNDFGPRVGFAWDVFGNAKTSLRGGYAISYEATLQQRLGLMRWNLPFYSVNRISNFLDGNPNANVVYGPVDGGQVTFLGAAPPAQHSGTGAQATGNISGWDPANPQTSLLNAIIFPNAQRDPFVENWFFGAQREVFPNLIVEINYVGTAGRKLFRAENVNRIPGGRLPEGSCVTDTFGRKLCSQIDSSTAANGLALNPNGRYLNPNYGTLRVWENSASSSYNGLQLSVNRQLSHGLQFSANYTYSHSIDDGSTWIGATANGAAAGDLYTTDQTQPSLDKGDSVFDIRHRLTFNYIWEIPFFVHRRDFVGALLRGWQLNGIWSFQTGAHWSPFNPAPAILQPRDGSPLACEAATFDPANCVNVGGDYNLDGESNDRPNAIANNFHPTHSQWADGFNLPENFFTAPCLGCVGNLGRNTFVGPGYWAADTSIFRNFSLSDRVRLQFRAEAFNVLNHTNFLIGNNTALHDPLFGQAGGTAPPRNLQLGLKLIF
jgi:Carboxypeptidase regulatory-like domain/TonB dependent receptor